MERSFLNTWFPPLLFGVGRRPTPKYAIAWLFYSCMMVLASTVAAWWHGPMILADEFVVKPHKRYLLNQYMSPGVLRLPGRVVCANRDAMVVEYEYSSLLEEEEETTAPVMIEKCIPRHFGNLDKKHKASSDDSTIVLLVLPDAPDSAYPEDLIIQDAKDLQPFRVGRFLWELCKVVVVTLSWLALCLVVTYEQLGVTARVRMRSELANPSTVVDVVLFFLQSLPPTFYLSWFGFPFLLKTVTSVQLDRKRYLSRMEGMIVKHKKLCGVLPVHGIE